MIVNVNLHNMSVMQFTLATTGTSFYLASSIRTLQGGATGMVAFGVLGWATSLATAIVVSGAGMAVLGLFVATMLINAAAMVGWLFPKQLVNLGFPSDPALWYTALGIVSSATTARRNLAI
jgi:hypothetical protein